MIVASSEILRGIWGFWTRQIGRGATLHITTFWHCACMTINSTRSFSLEVIRGGWDTHMLFLRACESGKHISAVPYTVGLLKQSHTSLRSRYLSSTGERSWSAVVWTCIPGRRTVAPLWGRRAWPWPPRPASPHPPACLGLWRRRGRTI